MLYIITGHHVHRLRRAEVEIGLVPVTLQIMHYTGTETLYRSNTPFTFRGGTNQYKKGFRHHLSSE
jgi:hypothetical protein